VDTSRYAELFLTESQDNLSAINHALLELERTPTAKEPVGALFRAVHTVKGMSATMGYAKVAELSHELETLLDLVRRGEQPVTAALMDALFAAADTLERSIELSVAGREDELDATAAIAALRAAAGPASATSPPAARAVKRKRRRGDAAAPPDASAVTLIITLEPNTPMPGVRAFLTLERARSLGTVVRTVPEPEALDADGFDGRLTIDVRTDAADDAIDRAIRSAGFVASVEIGRAGAAPMARAAPAPNGNGPLVVASAGRASELVPARAHRHIRIDLHRLDTLMNLIGELVITRGR